MDMIKNIFFDFDGVLAESVGVKTQAFYDVYLPFGEKIAEKAKQYHLAHGGVSRFEKFRYYHREFFNADLTDESMSRLVQQYSALVKKSVIHAKEVDGANTFLEKYKNRFHYWLITGTPTDEIKEIIAHRNMLSYFVKICGSPQKKKYWTEFLINKYQLTREETIFVGDATADYEASIYSGLTFFLRKAPYNQKLFENYKGHNFTNFQEFEKILLL